MKPSDPSKEEVMARINERYGSLTNPSFHWVQGECDRDAYKSLRTTLAEHFDMEDITDLNSDVSFGYELGSKRQARAWTIRLSMLGPYAMIYRHDGYLQNTIMDGPDDIQTSEEKLLVETCRAEGCAVLSFDLLSVPVPLRLFDAAPDRVRVYQALFSDVDFLPGEYEQSRK